MDDPTAAATVDENATPRLGALRAALTVICPRRRGRAFFTGLISTTQPDIAGHRR